MNDEILRKMLAEQTALLEQMMVSKNRLESSMFLYPLAMADLEIAMNRVSKTINWIRDLLNNPEIMPFERKMARLIKYLEFMNFKRNDEMKHFALFTHPGFCDISNKPLDLWLCTLNDAESRGSTSAHYVSAINILTAFYQMTEAEILSAAP